MALLHYLLEVILFVELFIDDLRLKPLHRETLCGLTLWRLLGLYPILNTSEDLCLVIDVVLQCLASLLLLESLQLGLLN